MNGLAVGRIVHFTAPDYNGTKVNGELPLACHAAIVTRLVDEEKGVINLQWFDDNSRHVARRVIHSEQPKENAWHWPERTD